MRCSLSKAYILGSLTYFTFCILNYFTQLNESSTNKADNIFNKQLLAVGSNVQSIEKSVIQTQQELSILKSEFSSKSLTNSDSNLPALYIITPTYSRWTQKAELVRISHSLALSFLNIHWIIVEDTKNLEPSLLLQNFKYSVETKFSSITVFLLTAVTPAETKLKNNDPNWLYPRGVNQRNRGIDFVRENHRNKSAVLYFADDDNTYDPQVFHEFVRLENDKPIGVLPVGIVGGLKWEGPICKSNRVTGFHTAWKKERPFPLDMAGFAVRVDQLVATTADFSNRVLRGMLESDFLLKCLKHDINVKGIGADWQKLQQEVWKKTQPLADNCSKVLVWHTRTEKPKTKDEDKLNKLGQASPEMEI